MPFQTVQLQGGLTKTNSNSLISRIEKREISQSLSFDFYIPSKFPARIFSALSSAR